MKRKTLERDNEEQAPAAPDTKRARHTAVPHDPTQGNHRADSRRAGSAPWPNAYKFANHVMNPAERAPAGTPPLHPIHACPAAGGPSFQITTHSRSTSPKATRDPAPDQQRRHVVHFGPPPSDTLPPPMHHYYPAYRPQPDLSSMTLINRLLMLAEQGLPSDFLSSYKKSDVGNYMWLVASFRPKRRDEYCPPIRMTELQHQTRFNNVFNCFGFINGRPAYISRGVIHSSNIRSCIFYLTGGRWCGQKAMVQRMAPCDNAAQGNVPFFYAKSFAKHPYMIEEPWMEYNSSSSQWVRSEKARAVIEKYDVTLARALRQSRMTRDIEAVVLNLIISYCHPIREPPKKHTTREVPGKGTVIDLLADE